MQAACSAQPHPGQFVSSAHRPRHCPLPSTGSHFKCWFSNVPSVPEASPREQPPGQAHERRVSLWLSSPRGGRFPQGATHTAHLGPGPGTGQPTHPPRAELPGLGIPMSLPGQCALKMVPRTRASRPTLAAPRLPPAHSGLPRWQLRAPCLHIRVGPAQVKGLMRPGPCPCSTSTTVDGSERPFGGHVTSGLTHAATGAAPHKTAAVPSVGLCTAGPHTAAFKGSSSKPRPPRSLQCQAVTDRHEN